MSPSIFYREQAARQSLAADTATLENVREQCERASNAWTALALRSERAENARHQLAIEKLDQREGEPLQSGVDRLSPTGDQD